MLNTKIKICGITNVADALKVSEAGVDAIGMVFYPPSPRYIAIEAAIDVTKAVGPFVTTVALFVNPEVSLVEKVLKTVKPHMLQFHGDEDGEFCQQFEHPYIKAVRVKEDTDIAQSTAGYDKACGFVFDAWSAGLYGGTGKTFRWEKIQGFTEYPLILAGGLTPENVADAISSVSPYAVDVSGGVEMSPGCKDFDKIRRFVNAVK